MNSVDEAWDSLVSHINMVDVSISNIEDFSIAEGDSHESFTINLLRISIKWILDLLGWILPILNWWSTLINSVGDLLILNLSVWVEFIESLLSDWNNVFENIP